LGKLEIYQVNDPEKDLIEHPFGMKEPDPSRCKAYPSIPTLILVPGLAFVERVEHLQVDGQVRIGVVVDLGRLHLGQRRLAHRWPGQGILDALLDLGVDGDAHQIKHVILG